MKHVKVFEQYVNEAKIPKIPFKFWESTGEDASDGQIWVAAEYKGKYYMTTAEPEPGTPGGFVDIDVNWIEEISKKEYYALPNM